MAAGRPQNEGKLASSLDRGESSIMRRAVATPYALSAAPQRANASGLGAGGLGEPSMGQMQPHRAIELQVRWGQSQPQQQPNPQTQQQFQPHLVQTQPLHWAAAGTGAAAFRGRGSSLSSGNTSGGSSGAGGSSQEGTMVSNSSGIAVGGNVSAAGFTIKRQRSTSGGGIYGSVGQRAIQQTSQEISAAEAKLRALQERCRELDEDNALMAAKEAVYLPYTQGWRLGT